MPHHADRGRPWAVAVAASLALLGSVLLPASSSVATPRGHGASTPPSGACAGLADVTFDEPTFEVTIVSTTEVPGDATTPAACRVTATTTHPPYDDTVTIWVALPAEGWNGRFQGTGGGGFSGGSEAALLAPLRQGFAAASTDTGHSGGSGSFALDEDGRLAWQLIQNNAYLGIHEAAVVGQRLTRAYYGRKAAYAYFNGCSTGGRQGLSEAQRYPDDYDGVLAAAPAINWQKLHIAQLWGQLAMLETDNPVASCKYDAFTAAAVRACDRLDGAVDGVINDVDGCRFDPRRLIGVRTDCGTITRADAEIVRRIWQGPRTSEGEFLWYGLEPGASFTGLNNTGGDPLQVMPFPTTMDWIRYFITQNPEWDVSALSQDLLERLWSQSLEQYGAVIGTDDPDLSDFAKKGGKLLLWHGWSDQLIFPRGTIDYYQRMVAEMGSRNVARFAQLYMAPGVAHCAGGTGPQPSGMFQALMDWVERDRKPHGLTAVKTDTAGNVTQSRPLCRYPEFAAYRGRGDVDDAASFRCVARRR